MSKISIIIKICKVNNLPQDVEDLIFAYFGEYYRLMDMLKIHKCFLYHIGYLQPNFYNKVFPNIIENVDLHSPTFKKSNLLMLNLLSAERANILNDYDVRSHDGTIGYIYQNINLYFVQFIFVNCTDHQTGCMKKCQKYVNYGKNGEVYYIFKYNTNSKSSRPFMVMFEASIREWHPEQDLLEYAEAHNGKLSKKLSISKFINSPWPYKIIIKIG
jgi:hypothetical protein